MYQKKIYILTGSICIILGTIGIFIPGLPTTPFLLLAAWFYTRSSQKLYHKLISSKVLGEYIRDYNRKKGLTLRRKIAAIAIMWTMITVSSVFFIKNIAGIYTVVSLGIIGSIVMGAIIKTVKEE